MELKLRYKAQSLAHSRPRKNRGSDFHCKPLRNLSSWTLQNLTFKWASLYPCENAKAGGEASLPWCCPAWLHLSVLSDGRKALTSQHFIEDICDHPAYLKFCINFVVQSLDFKMSLEPEEKPLGKESKECVSRMQSSCLFSKFCPSSDISCSDPAQVTVLAAWTSWRQAQNSWLPAFKDFC